MGLQQGIDLGRPGNGAAAGNDLVVGLDAVIVIEIVDRDAEGFPDPTNNCVAEPVDPLARRAVAGMKPCHRVGAVSPDAGRVR